MLLELNDWAVCALWLSMLRPINSASAAPIISQ
jgi:hypothetical protein